MSHERAIALPIPCHAIGKLGGGPSWSRFRKPAKCLAAPTLHARRNRDKHDKTMLISPWLCRVCARPVIKIIITFDATRKAINKASMTTRFHIHVADQTTVGGPARGTARGTSVSRRFTQLRRGPVRSLPTHRLTCATRHCAPEIVSTKAFQLKNVTL